MHAYKKKTATIMQSEIAWIYIDEDAAVIVFDSFIKIKIKRETQTHSNRSFFFFNYSRAYCLELFFSRSL